MTDLKTSQEWQEESTSTMIIMDPDGWNRRDLQYSFYEEKISKTEFDKRVSQSTVMIKKPTTQTANTFATT